MVSPSRANLATLSYTVMGPWPASAHSTAQVRPPMPANRRNGARVRGESVCGRDLGMRRRKGKLTSPYDDDADAGLRRCIDGISSGCESLVRAVGDHVELECCSKSRGRRMWCARSDGEKMDERERKGEARKPSPAGAPLRGVAFPTPMYCKQHRVPANLVLQPRRYPKRASVGRCSQAWCRKRKPNLLFRRNTPSPPCQYPRRWYIAPGLHTYCRRDVRSCCVSGQTLLAVSVGHSRTCLLGRLCSEPDARIDRSHAQLESTTRMMM